MAIDTSPASREPRVMTTPHPLDRPAHAALFTRQAQLASGGALARRIRPEYGPFAASLDYSTEAMQALVALNPPEGGLALVEPEDAPVSHDLPVASQAACWQMLMRDFHPRPGGAEIEALEPEDAEAMQTLAALTRPGPFSTRTHELGRFFGVKRDGRLIAMAGERLRPDGFTEVSGVCTHPDFQGEGLAGQLMSRVIEGVLARGEQAFLHAYADNHGAIALYKKLGFFHRSTVILTVTAPQSPGSSTV